MALQSLGSLRPGRIVTSALLICLLFLANGTIYLGAVALLNPAMAFDGQLLLPDDRALRITKKPACTRSMPAPECYYRGLSAQPTLTLIYNAPGQRHMLLSLKLPG